MPKAQTSVEEPVPALDADVVDKKLETIEAEPVAAEVPPTNGTSDPVVEPEEAPAAPVQTEEVPTPEAAEKAVEEENLKEPEKPAEPTASPSITRLPSTTKPAAPAQQAAPPKPLTWASRAAAAAGPKPAVPAVAPKTSTPPAQPRAAPPVTAPKHTPSAPAPATTTDKEKENAPSTPGGWQTAGSDHAKRQNRPQSISNPPEKEGTMGYVRNVTEKVPDAELKAALGAYGNLIYFDINRAKVFHLLFVT